MKRRDFIKAIGAAAAWPLAARAQQTASPVIGYLSSKGTTAEAGIIAAIRQGLNERGFVEGKTVAFAYRWAEGDYSHLPRLAAELVNQNVNVIAASGLPAALAAKAATPTIPIVFRLAVDPVAFGLTQSLDRPGGNITGVTMLFDPLTPKKLELLHQIVPSTVSIGILINPNNQNAASHQEHAERAAAALGFNLSVLKAGHLDELEPAFATARQKGVGALLIGDDPLFDVLNQQLVDTVARHRIPTMYYVRDFVVTGGLISYGPSFDEMAKQVGVYLGRILEGTRPADLPVQQPTKFELVINIKTARALGLALPPALLARADEVIE
ncbi:MAG TPA: ABC transporter substrate-binding protein [Pseudolabrys sp.]|nr:ABC transporter substrate-binding protein [Pseudolabrys sp.]